MADFNVFGPDAAPVTGTSGVDRLIYTLGSGGFSGVVLSVAGSLATGYSGTFDAPGTDDTDFTGIENFSFFDHVGGNDALTTGDGDDNLNGLNGNDTLDGAGGMDALNGGRGDDFLYGRSGNDQLEGSGGRDRLFGGDGNDFLSGGWGSDRLFAGAGDDFVDTGRGNNTVYGGAGSDFIISGPGVNLIGCGAGDDFVEQSHTGRATINGGAGDDTVYTFFQNIPWNNNYSLTFNMASGLHRVTTDSVVDSTITNVENFGVGGRVDSRITGNALDNDLSSDRGNDRIAGWGGNDMIFAGGGRDTVAGNAGDDVLDGGAGNDLLRGGTGDDTFVYNRGWDRILDFTDDADTIQIDSSLVAPGTTVQDILDEMASVAFGSAILSFGSSGSLRIDGVSDLSSLADDMVIV